MSKMPSVLPRPVRDGYTGTPELALRRHQMEDGQSRTQRRWASQPFVYNLTWKLTWHQAKVFEGWLEYDLARGIGTFDVELAGKMITVTPVTGEPVYTPTGDGFNATMMVREYRAMPTQRPNRAFIPSWPAALPELERAGYSYGKADSIAHSDIQEGRSQSRVRFRDRVTRYGSKILVSPEERDLFWEFYREELYDGVSNFLAPFVNSASSENRRAKFVEVPQETPNGAWFNITMMLETVNAPIISEQEYREENFEFINDYVVEGYVIDGYVGEYV